MRPRRLRGRRPAAMARSSVPPRGSGRFGVRPGTRRPDRRRRRRRPGARRGGTGDRNRASDRYPRRLGRVLPGGGPVPVRAAGRRPRERRQGLAPTSGDPARWGAQRGGSRGGTIDPSCDPTPCPSAPGPPGRLSSTGGRSGENLRALCALFFAPLCGATTKTTTGKGPPRTSPGNPTVARGRPSAPRCSGPARPTTTPPAERRRGADAGHLRAADDPAVATILTSAQDLDRQHRSPSAPAGISIAHSAAAAASQSSPYSARTPS